MIPEPPLNDLTGATCYIRGSIYMTQDNGRKGGTQKAGENHSVFILTSTGNQFSSSCFHSSRGHSVCRRQVTRDGRGGTGGECRGSAYISVLETARSRTWRSSRALGQIAASSCKSRCFLLLRERTERGQPIMFRCMNFAICKNSSFFSPCRDKN